MQENLLIARGCKFYISYLAIDWQIINYTIETLHQNHLKPQYFQLSIDMMVWEN